MGAISNFWLLMVELICIHITSKGVYSQSSHCEVFPGCTCSIVLNDRGAELGISANCSYRGLTSVPTPATTSSPTIYELKLNNNNIKSLEENILSTISLTKLDLGDNPISTVHNDTFRTLARYLKILVLSGNSSSQPPTNALQYLSQLEELVLENYMVPDLNEQGYFLSFTKLTDLTLDNWGLTHIGPDSFHNPNSFLLSLKILNQPMTFLPLDALHSPDLAQLQKLQFSNLLINTVSLEVFANLNSIKELDLSQNHIDTLEIDCFKGIDDTLIKLSLGSNSLKNEASKLMGLTGLTNLEELDLSVNEFTSVPSLSQITKPLKLNLNGNRIKSIASNNFTGFADKLDTFNLSSQVDTLSIDPNTFTNFLNLRVLDLSRQTELNRKPLVLPQSLSKAALTLKELYVQGQEISPSELWFVLGQLLNLETINLASTHLTNIQNMTFFNLTYLKKLDLSSNRLNTITQYSLAGPRKALKYLSLTNNNIFTLSSCLFYQYQSFPITVALGTNSLTCDCSLKWLWERIKNGSILSPAGQEAMCSDNQLLTNKNNFCSSTFVETLCSENYLTPTLTIKVEVVDNTTITVSWYLSDERYIKEYYIKVASLPDDITYYDKNQTPTSVRISNLAAKKKYEVCVTAFFTNSDLQERICTIASTGIDNTSPQSQDGLSGQEIGIIVGCIVGAVVLLVIVAVLFYLLVIRRRLEKKTPDRIPTQPRNFLKSELPSMTEDTRTFTKPKRQGAAGAPENKEGMQVVATISDGQMGHRRTGRAEMLNFDGSYKTNGASKPSSVSSSHVSYENDNRPLPPPPSRQSPAPLPVGYYNQGFRDDKYDEISPGKESTL